MFDALIALFNISILLLAGFLFSGAALGLLEWNKNAPLHHNVFSVLIALVVWVCTGLPALGGAVWIILRVIDGKTPY